MATNYTLLEFVQELQTWGHFSEEELERAKASKKTTANDPDFKKLITRFVMGHFDNDIDLLIHRVKNML